MNYRTITKANEDWWTSWTADHARELAGWHMDTTGEDINSFNGRNYEIALKDISGRRLTQALLNYRGESAVWGEILDGADCTLSAGTLEVKVLFCGRDYFTYPNVPEEKAVTVLDRLKVDELKGDPNAQVLYLYPDAEKHRIGWRMFKVSDILRYGVLKTGKGKRDSFAKAPSDKELYEFPTDRSRKGEISDRWLTGMK